MRIAAPGALASADDWPTLAPGANPVAAEPGSGRALSLLRVPAALAETRQRTVS